MSAAVSRAPAIAFLLPEVPATVIVCERFDLQPAGAVLAKFLQGALVTHALCPTALWQRAVVVSRPEDQSPGCKLQCNTPLGARAASGLLSSCVFTQPSLLQTKGTLRA